MPERAEVEDALLVVLEAERIGTEAMQAHLPTWRNAYHAYSAGGVVTTPKKIQVFQNHVLPVIETIVPRDATALHPQRPFFPIGAVLAEEEWRAQLKTQAVDAMASKGKYFPAFVSGLRACELYGTSFIEPQQRYWIENTMETKPIYNAMGQITEFEDSFDSQLQDGAKFVAHKPWNVLCPPNGNDLDDKEWIVIRGFVNISAIKKALKLGAPWKLPKGKTLKDLEEGPSGRGMEDWAQQFRKDKSLFTENVGKNICTLHRYYSEDRWIVVVNYSLIIMDTENQHVNLARFKKPIAQMKMNSRVGDDEFYGTGWYERTAALGEISDLIMSTKAHSLLLSAARWVVVNPKKMDPEKVRRASYGGILDMTLEGGDPREALNVVDMGGEIPGLYEFQQWLETIKDKQTGTGDIIEGIAPSPRQTGGATMKLAEEASTRIAFGSRFLEATYLPEMADLVTAMASQMTIVQLADIVGWENAVAVRNADPRNIPGGYQYEFDGSDRVSGRARKFEGLKEFWNYLSQDETIAANPQAKSLLIEKFAQYVEVFKRPEIEILKAGPMQPPMQPGIVPEAAPSMEPPQQVATPATNQEMGVPQ